MMGLLPAVRLWFESGPKAGQSVNFTDHQTWVVGRSGKAQLCLPDDPKCSRFHCRFEIRPPHCVAVDLKSRNGTIVNGDRLKAPRTLGDGDVIQIGDTKIEVSITQGESSGASEATMLVGKGSLIPEISGFRLTHTIGRGGMGTVFHGLEESSRRPVAVKVIHPATNNAEALRQFVREASISVQLCHDHIVKTLEFGVQDNSPFLVMEYLDTVDLWQILGDTSPADRMRIASGLVVRILDGLHYAHGQRIVHRDVKPSNMLVYRAGTKLQVKLADFGLAKDFMNAGQSAMSTSTEVKGSLPYMPPEQVLNCRYVKPSCDVYSAGATLYHLLSGHRPYEFSTATDGLTKILNESPTPLTEHLNEIPAELEAVVAKAMSREATERYESAKDMRLALLPFTKRGTYA